MADVVAALSVYADGLQGGQIIPSDTIDTVAPTSAMRGPFKREERTNAWKFIQEQLDAMRGTSGAPGVPSKIMGRPLDYVYLSFLRNALFLRKEKLQRKIAKDLDTLIDFRNAVMHFRHVKPGSFDEVCLVASRVCGALGQDEQPERWIGQWFGGAEAPKHRWRRILNGEREGPDTPCVDYGDLAVPPIGRFRQRMIRSDRVLFPGGFYKTKKLWIRLEPVWIEQNALAGRSLAKGRLMEANEYECLIMPEVEAAEVKGAEAEGPSGLRFCISRVEQRLSANSARVGFSVSRARTGAELRDEAFLDSDRDLIRRVFKVSARSIASQSR
jgi:hypothetical protein